MWCANWPYRHREIISEDFEDLDTHAAPIVCRPDTAVVCRRRVYSWPAGGPMSPDGRSSAGLQACAGRVLRHRADDRSRQLCRGEAGSTPRHQIRGKGVWVICVQCVWAYGKLVHSCYLNKSSNPNPNPIPDPKPKPNPNPNLDSAVIGRTY